MYLIPVFYMVCFVFGIGLTDNVPVHDNALSEDLECPDSSNKWLDIDKEFCYLFENDKRVNWYEARNECRRKGGDLASILSEEEAETIDPFVRDVEGTFAIGLHRNLKNKNVFQWSDGSELNYTKWAPGEPNYWFEECAQIWTDLMMWSDMSCRNIQGYICKARKALLSEPQTVISTSMDHVSTMSSKQSEVTTAAPKDHVYYDTLLNEKQAATSTSKDHVSIMFSKQTEVTAPAAMDHVIYTTFSKQSEVTTAAPKDHDIYTILLNETQDAISISKDLVSITLLNETQAPVSTSKDHVSTIFSKQSDVITAAPEDHVIHNTLLNETQAAISGSKDDVSTSGMPAATVLGIVFCNFLLVLLIGGVIYYSHKFWKRHSKSSRQDNYTSF